MITGKKLIITFVSVSIVGVGLYIFVFRDAIRSKNVQEIKRQVETSVSDETKGPANMGDVSPYSGLPCDNWNRRAIAVMQPVDMQARPVAGFSDAEMVFEMPNPAQGIFVTRLMGVYQCHVPEEVGSMRSSRHDYISIAKGLDAIFVGWGGSAFSIKKLNDGVIDNIDCNGEGGKKAPQCCFRKERTGAMRIEDTGYAKGSALLDCSKEFGYRMQTNFSGYLHKEDIPESERPNGGHLRIGFPGIMEAEYDYDRASNSYLRTWGGAPDIDRNNGKRLAPKNIVVVIADNEQIMADSNYLSQGLQDPWEGLPEEKKTGPHNISGRYNNIQMGDPWFDSKESGEAHFYMNGKEYRGTWKKSRSTAESKLTFYDESGQEVRFVPGQIWVEVMVPGQAFRWQVL